MTTQHAAAAKGEVELKPNSDGGGSNGGISNTGQVTIQKPEHSMLFCLGVCAAYGSTSVAITFANKYVLTTYNFQFELSLILLQLLLSTLSIALLFFTGAIPSPPLNVFNLRKTFFLSIWFFIYVITGLGSLRSLTVPTWSALRRLTSIFILVLDWGEGKLAPTRIWLSVLIMLTGGIVAAKGDLQGTVRGYTHVLLNCGSSALYLHAVAAAKRDTGMSELGILLYSNTICLPFCTAAILVFNEASDVLRFPHFADPGFQTALFTSAFMAGLLNYLVFLSASVNSPLTTCITGQAKNVVGSLGGFLLWPTPASSNPVHLAGCGIGLAGSIWYAVQKYLERPKQ